MKRPIYYDTETTGLDPKNDRIIEIAAYDPQQNKTFCSLINPRTPIPQTASDISHITDEMVKDSPTFEKVANDFMDFCNDNCILIAHNNDAFDIHFLKNEFHRENIPMPNWIFLDSLKWARKYRPDLPKHALQYLRKIYNIEANNAHRALDDVIILEKVFNCLIGDLDIETVHRLLYVKETITRMPFGKHQGKLLEEIPKSYLSWLKEQGAFEKPENANLKECLEKQGLLI